MRASWLLLLALALPGCVPRQADLLFENGDYAAAINAYEQYLVRRAELSEDDAPVLLRIAIAYSRAESPSYDPSRSKHYLRMLVDLFPRAPQTLEAEMMLEALDTAERLAGLERDLAQRDERLTALDAVLQSVAATGKRLEQEVRGKDERQADLESRVAELTRQARHLMAEIAALEGELEALKQIDLESVAVEGVEPPE